MKNLVAFVVIVCLLASCKTEQKKENKTAPTPVEVKDGKFGDLESLPKRELNRLFKEATYVDYIFHNLPFSISQDDKPSISSNLRLIAKEKLGPINKGCQPIGREFFHVGGAIAYEADVYFQDGCYGYVFLEKEKPIYANKLSEAGMKFYNNLISQAQQIQNKAANGGG